MEITKNLLTKSKYCRSGEKQNKIQYIVIHWVGNPNTSALANRNYFNNLSKTHTTTASAHYIIGLKGEIIQCIPDEEVAFHAGSRSMNRKSIGIEDCHPDWKGKFNSKTYNSLVELVASLMKKYKIDINHVIRHYDVTKKTCPRYYVEHKDAWEQLKKDILNKYNKSVKTYSTTVGKSYKLKSDTVIYSNQDLSGKKYNYLKNTTVIVKKHVSTSIDYIQVKATGRLGYIKVKYLK